MATTTEDKVMKRLLNEMSERIQIPEHKEYVQFQLPSFSEKYRGRAWVAKKMKEFNIPSAVDDDPQMYMFFRYWGLINTSVKHLYYPDPSGAVSIGGESYSEYKYDAATDLDYTAVFEKYAIEEVYNKGESEEAFVLDTFTAYALWSANEDEEDVLEEDEIKNS